MTVNPVADKFSNSEAKEASWTSVPLIRLSLNLTAQHKDDMKPFMAET